MSTNAGQPKSISDRQRDAALGQVRQQAAEHRRITEIVLGSHSPAGRHVGEIVNIGGDYVVEVRDGDKPATWTTVVGGKATPWHMPRQEKAVLHLIARRYDDDNNTNVAAVFYAGRVLGIPEKE